MHFAKITGYQDIKQKLAALFAQGKMPQAQLITGPIGSPVLPFALSLATYLHCQNKASDNPCLTCPSCKKADKYLHPDLYFAFPIPSAAQKTTLKAAPIASALPAWRSFLTQNPYQDLSAWGTYLGHSAKQMHIHTAQIDATLAFLRTHPIESTHKVVVMWLPEHMSLPAANKLLKTLEEPPKHTFVILASHDPTQILPTISSRTWPLMIPPFQDSDLLQTLVTQYPHASLEKLKQAVRTASGNLLLAAELATQATAPHFESLATWFRSLYAHHWEQTLAIAEQFAKSTPTEQKTWIRYALHLMRTTLQAQQGTPPRPSQSSPQHTFCHKFGQTITFDQLTYIIQQLEEMYHKLTRNAHPKLLFTVTTLALAAHLNPSRRPAQP